MLVWGLCHSVLSAWMHVCPCVRWCGGVCRVLGLKDHDLFDQSMAHPPSYLFHPDPTSNNSTPRSNFPHISPSALHPQVTMYHKNVARQAQQQASWLAKRRQENQARRAAGVRTATTTWECAAIAARLFLAVKPSQTSPHVHFLCACPCAPALGPEPSSSTPTLTYVCPITP